MWQDRQFIEGVQVVRDMGFVCEHIETGCRDGSCAEGSDQRILVHSVIERQLLCCAGGLFVGIASMLDIVGSGRTPVVANTF